MGSSPLARGLRAGLGVSDDHRRIIPARAGFTRTWPSCPPARADHPRSRGVYLGVLPDALAGTGSSPLARGLHLDDADRDDRSRIIPARAGFTR